MCSTKCSQHTESMQKVYKITFYIEILKLSLHTGIAQNFPSIRLSLHTGVQQNVDYVWIIQECPVHRPLILTSWLEPSTCFTGVVSLKFRKSGSCSAWSTFLERPLQPGLCSFGLIDILFVPHAEHIGFNFSTQQTKRKLFQTLNSIKKRQQP
jgi:hypothetical protein